LKSFFHISLAAMILLSVSFSTHPLAAPPAPVQQTASTEKVTVIKKPTILFFTASWCGPCRKVKKYVLPNPKVSELMKNFNVVFIDVDRPSPLKKKYDVRVIPHFCFLDTKGKLKYSMKGYQPAANFALVLKNVLEEEK
jgi:thioredoxin-related protein